jgi:hypothetical protein
MSKPNLDLQVEPVDSGKAEFLLLAATTASGTTGVKIVLRLRLQNNGTSTVKVKGIRFSFPGSSYPAVDMQGVNKDGSLDLVAGVPAYWCDGVVYLDAMGNPVPSGGSAVINSVYLTGAAPAQVKVDVSCKDFTEPASITLSLQAHKSPVAGDAYRFPFAAGDLRADEYMSASAVHWADGGMGTQIFAHDIGVIGWDNNAKQWSGILPGTDGSKNEHYRIWGKPVRAAAAGTVEDWADGLDDNTVLGKFPVPTPAQLRGNHITLRHGTEVVTYCHFRKGSLVESLKKKGTAVYEGQMLGQAGNTGNTTNPHTHVECERASDVALRPLPFRSGWLIDPSKLSPPGASGPWFKLQGHGICKDSASIWPASTSPGFPVPTFGISMQGDWGNSFFINSDLATFEQTAQNLFDHNGRRLIRVTTYLENGARRWVGIARDGDWANHWWISPDLSSFQQTAQDLFDKKGLRLIYVSSFVDGGQRKWIGIARGGDWASRLIIKNDLSSFSTEAQTLFDHDGLRLIHVMTWAEGGQRKWFGIARQGDWANRWWISPDLGSFSTTAQQLFDHEGKRLVHVTAYKEGNEHRWIGIARSGNWANRWYFHADLDTFGLEAQHLFDSDHLRLVHVEMLE